jgi:predicted nucleic acid-binding Zn ribbon protein
MFFEGRVIKGKAAVVVLITTDRPTVRHNSCNNSFRKELARVL